MSTDQSSSVAKFLMSSKHRFATEEIEKFSTVDLISELKRRYQVLSRPERNCVLLGPDYVGIQTQSTFLRKEWGLCTIKRSDIMKQDNTLDQSIKSLSDEIGSFRCRRGFALENFPETKEEAGAFDIMIKSKHEKRSNYQVFVLDLPSTTTDERRASSESLLARARGMLIHPGSGRTYNTSDPDMSPQSPNVDDVTGEGLICPNWNYNDLNSRLEDWWNRRKPELVSFFSSRCNFIDASRSRDSVSMEISKTLLSEPTSGSPRSNA